MKSSLALALALGVSATALAVPGPAPVQQKGTPELSAKPLSTYGIEVPARSALRSLIPTGWRLFVHKSAELPTTISWKPGDQWTDVLGSASNSAGLSTLVDWETKSVFIRSLEVALEENAVRGEIAQAAVTPLPRFEAPAGLTNVSEKTPDSVAAVQAEPALQVVPSPPTVTYDIKTRPAGSEDGSPDEAVAQANAQDQGASTVVARSAASDEAKPATSQSAVAVEVATLAKAILAEKAAKHSSTEASTPAETSNQVQAHLSGAEPSVAVAEVAAAADSKNELPLAESLTPQETVVAIAPALAAAADVQQSEAPAAAEAQVRPSVYSVSTSGEITAPNAMVALAAVVQEGSLPVEEGSLRKSQDVAKDASDQTRMALEQLLAASRDKEADLRRQLSERKDTTRAAAVEVSASSGGVRDIAAGKVTSSKEAELKFFGAPSVAPALEASAEARSSSIPSNLTAMAMVPAAPAAAQPRWTNGMFSTATEPAQNKVQPLKAVEPVVVISTAQASAADPATKTMPQSLQAPVVPQIPVLAVNPSVEQQKRMAEASKGKPVPARSTEDFTYTAPVALNKAPLRTVVQGIANRYGLRMVYIAPDIKMPGPVTLLSQSADQDLALLKKAMGLYAPVNFELTVTGDVLVESKDASYVATHRAKAAAAAKALSEARNSQAEQGGRVSDSLTTTPAAETPRAAPLMVFTLQAGQALEDALRVFLTSRGYTQEWKVSGGFDANKTLAYEGNTVAEVLSKVLVPLGISADIFTTDKHIVIRPGNYQE